MILKSVTLKNFRSYNYKEIFFEKKNYITGANGSGKTSLLESISVVLNRRSFRTSKLSEIITINKDYSLVTTTVEKQGLKYDFLIKIEKDNKYHFINKKKIDKIKEITINFPIIVHSPYYEGLTDKNNRKKLSFLDKILYLIDKNYRILIKKHNRIIKQKKNILSNFYNQKTINFYNDILVELLKEIYERRKQLLYMINEMLNKHKTLNWLYFKIYEENISKLIKKEYMIKKNFLSSNSHTIKICDKNGNNMENFLSYGQKKELSIFTIYTSLKIIEENIKDDIIILLDDFETGLDEVRIKSFYELFSENQLIITGVEKKHIEDINLISL